MAYNSNFVSTPNRLRDNRRNLRWSHEEPAQPHRSDFSKDRDRILYSKSFLRLRGKTQVFILHDNDYIRTRLTHTLEVNQIAKTIAIALGQNVELTEAIALGHDVGHTPFGHVGERTLDSILLNDANTQDNQKGFKHNLQALRLLCELEKGANYPEQKGLNLTKYVLWGIAHHSSVGNKPFYDSILNELNDYWSFEGYIVAMADEIAQRHHDIEDSLRYNIVSRDELIGRLSDFSICFAQQDRDTYNKLQEGIRNLEAPVFSALFSRLVVNLYVVNAINNIKQNFRNFEERHEINNKNRFVEIKPTILEEEHREIVSFSNELRDIDNDFQSFLKSNVLSSFNAQSMDGKGEYIINKLYSAFKNNPQQLPDTAERSFFDFIGRDFKRSDIMNVIPGNESVLHRCIVDYIGGMTDRFAYQEYDRLYGTRLY